MTGLPELSAKKKVVNLVHSSLKNEPGVAESSAEPFDSAVPIELLSLPSFREKHQARNPKFQKPSSKVQDLDY